MEREEQAQQPRVISRLLSRSQAWQLVSVAQSVALICDRLFSLMQLVLPLKEQVQAKLCDPEVLPPLISQVWHCVCCERSNSLHCSSCCWLYPRFHPSRLACHRFDHPRGVAWRAACSTSESVSERALQLTLLELVSA